jgi:ligand-binding sensor domain-containing protein
MAVCVWKRINIVGIIVFTTTMLIVINCVSQAKAQINDRSKKADPQRRVIIKPPAGSYMMDKGGNAVGWDSYKEPGPFVMALTREVTNMFWVGTEGNGVWRLNLNAINNRQWTQFKTKDGLGDDYAYSVAVDKQGRIWAGHLNHGVSVFNGKSWKNYDVPNGPIGERVFKIAVCPVDGDVWMGTSAGLTRYSVSKDTWTHFTRNSIPNAEGRRKNEEMGQGANEIGKQKAGSGNHLIQNDEGRMMNDEVGQSGKRKAESGDQTPQLPASNSYLPSDQISAIAFDAKGNIYVGTQCDGIAMASRETDYRDWRQVPLAEQKVPTFAGYGLPSKLINDLLVTSDGTVYAATDGGLTWSTDSGVTWFFRRGKDFPDKMKGLANGPPKGWSAKAIPKDLPPEDYVTCLAEDDAGVIWMDFRQHGLLALSGYSYEELEKVSAKQTAGADYGRAILPMPDFRPWLASYGKGLLRAAAPRQLRQNHVAKTEAPDLAIDAPFPSPARAPDLAGLNGLLKEVESVPSARLTNGAVIPLEDDWRTEGQWTGRYGRFWIVLCANWF